MWYCNKPGTTRTIIQIWNNLFINDFNQNSKKKIRLLSIKVIWLKKYNVYFNNKRRFLCKPGYYNYYY